MASVSAPPGSTQRSPFIDTLAEFLIYSKRSPSVPSRQICLLHMSLLTALSILSTKHEDAITLLSESQALIPRLIVRIQLDSSLIHESDGMGFGAVSLPRSVHRRE